jgi:hypothetical protein
MNLKLVYIIFLAPCPLKGNASSFECHTVKLPLFRRGRGVRWDLGANAKISNNTNEFTAGTYDKFWSLILQNLQ